MRTFSFLLLLFFPINASASLLISEVMWAGSDLSSSDEWIEFACREDATDISNFRLMSVSQSGSVQVEKELFRFGSGTFAESGSYFIISNYDAMQSRLLDEPAFISTGLSLPNSKLHLRLYDGSGSLIDEVDDGIGNPFAGANISGEVKSSMERISFELFGNTPDAWVTASRSFGFDSGALLFGTPGFRFEEEHESGSVIDPPITNSGSFSKIFINELFPNPKGSDDGEWIELMNPEDHSVQLSDFTIVINGKNTKLSGDISANGLFVFQKSVGGFTLPNDGGFVQLKYKDEIIDTLQYGSATDGISFGRLDSSDIFSFCIPSPGAANTDTSQDVSIQIQSGTTDGIGSVSLNLQAIVTPDTPSLFSCRFDFGDRTSVDSCNPASHSFDESGQYDITLEAMTQCGESFTKNLTVYVREEQKSVSSSSSSAKKSNSSSPKKDSSSSTETTVKAYESPTEEAPVFAGTVAEIPILLSETYTHPLKGEEEWIELFNPNDESVSLHGYFLKDASKKNPFALADSIGPNQFLAFPKSQTKISLNDDGDTVSLLSPAHDPIDIEVPKMKAGESYALIENEWCVTTQPTSESFNICIEPVSNTTKKTSSQKVITAKKMAAKVAGVKVKYAGNSSQSSSMRTEELLRALEKAPGTTAAPSQNEDRAFPAGEVALLGNIVLIGLLVSQKWPRKKSENKV